MDGPTHDEPDARLIARLGTDPHHSHRGAGRNRFAARVDPVPFASLAGPAPMQILPVDLVSLVATILGISIVLIPVIGVTARFALKPTAEALSRFFDHQGLTDTVRVLERRLDFQEHQIDAMENQLRRLTEGSEFDRKLLEARRTPEASASDSPTEQG